MDDLISRITRELPDTDRDRYDIAYERGRAQARSSLLAGGLALGAVAGSAAMFLLDPERGKGRRTALAERLAAMSRGAGSALGGKTTHLRNQVVGKATELGLPGTAATDDEPALAPAFAPDPLPVLEPATPAVLEPVAAPVAAVPVFEDTSTRSWRVADDELEPAGTGSSQR